MTEIKIGDKILKQDAGKDCFIIAEAGINHNGSKEMAMKLIDAAVDAGADAVKFQTYKTKNIITRNVEMAKYQKKIMKNEVSQYDMLKTYELSYNDFSELKAYCDSKGIIFLSTPHTPDTIDFLNGIVPAFKIGSGDLTNLPFLKQIARLGKPMILGTGMANMDEVKEAFDAITMEGNNKIVMLHCTTEYPCPPGDVNLLAMNAIKKVLGCLVGYSDHTEGIKVPLMAVRNGAALIEKHFTTDRSLEGPDHKASLEPSELKVLITKIRSGEFAVIDTDDEILGNETKNPTKNELETAKLIRKSIIAAKKILKGSKVTHSDIIIKRPGTGLRPKEYDNVLGRQAVRDIQIDDLINEEDLK